MRLSYTLADFPHEMIEIECAKCGRHGRLRTARLLAPCSKKAAPRGSLGAVEGCVMDAPKGAAFQPRRAGVYAAFMPL
jgi:hypothetical protein